MALRRINSKFLKLLPSSKESSRTIIVPPDFKVERTIQQVVSSLSIDVIGGPKYYDPDQYNKAREELMHILPKSQDELPPRKMLDSYDAALIPLGSDRILRDRYSTIHGGVRIGRLLEDMDIFAVHLVFKHVLNPRQKEGMASPFSIVTALVDQIDFTGEILSDSDIRISGHVTWVGRSSAESTLYLEQVRDGEWRKVTEAKFVLVARDPTNRGSAVLNPLETETAEEKEIFHKGEQNKVRRFAMSQDSLFRIPPTVAEQKIIHEFFIRTVDHKAMSFKARIKPDNSVWMEDAKLKNLIICQPENRNRFNKIFGGFIMRQAFELAWANTHVFGKCRPFIVHVDDIWFRKPVEVGSMLYFNSQISYTEDKYIQTRVSAEVLDPETGGMSVTNVFQFTFELRKQEPPQIIPKTYHEAMMYLTGRRHFLNSTIHQ
jgi:acyl-coenzyme A thioesterase 9